MNDDEGKQNWLGLLIPTVTFLVGLALGGVLVYANVGGGADSNVAEQSVTDTAAADDASAVVTVPAACDKAAAKVREAYGLLRTAVDQVRDFQADALVGTLNELEDVDGEARVLVTECSDVEVENAPEQAPEDAEPEEPGAPEESAEPENSDQ